MQHARLFCLLLSSRVCLTSCPLSQWCYLTILCHSLLLLPSVFPSIRVFSKESVLHISWPKYWHFSLASVLPLRMDWFDLLEVQGTLKSLLQHYDLKASILWRSAVFMVQLSHSYMTTEKTIALTIWTFVRQVMPLLFSMLSRFLYLSFLGASIF